VVFCDLPQVLAEAVRQSGLISERTKAALAQAKARGVRLGNPWLQPGTREQAVQAAAAKRRLAVGHAAGVLPYIEAARKAGHHAGAARGGTERTRRPHGTRRALACGDCVAGAGTRCWGDAAL
jgi:DNA invertase Pin-like site-specific DNA recombinase